MADVKELYVVCIVDKNYDIVEFATGGGSSTLPSIKAFERESSAKRSLASSKHRAVLQEGDRLAVRKFKEAK